MIKCDKCKVRKYCEDYVCLEEITCDETREMIGQIKADAIDECISKAHCDDADCFECAFGNSDKGCLLKEQNK